MSVKPPFSNRLMEDLRQNSPEVYAQLQRRVPDAPRNFRDMHEFRKNINRSPIPHYTADFTWQPSTMAREHLDSTWVQMDRAPTDADGGEAGQFWLDRSTGEVWVYAEGGV